MYNFTVQTRPLSYNSKDAVKKQQYKDLISSKFAKKYSTKAPSSKMLYGKVIYFRPQRDGSDADNISKHVWDALNRIAYDDDKSIKYRSAIIIEHDEVSKVDISELGTREYRELTKAFQNEEAIIFIEINQFDFSLIKILQE